MTRVMIKNRDGMWDININGHAENPYPDIQGNLLCASVSILAYTLMQTLMDMDIAGDVKRYEYSCDDGKVRIVVCPKESERWRVKERIRTILTGYQMLEEQFPGIVRVEGEIGEETD